MNKIRILVVDDQTILQQALVALLEKQQDFEVVGTADNGKEGIKLVAALRPDVALIDVEMPRMDGISVTRLIGQRFERTKVLVLTSHDDSSYLSESLRAGAAGYLLKNTPAEDLVHAIRQVYRGYGQISPGLLEKMVRPTSEPPQAQPQPVAEPQPQLSNPPARSADPRIAERLYADAELACRQSFAPQRLGELAATADDRQLVLELLSRIRTVLQTEPTNLSALYLAGCLCRRSVDLDSSAQNYLRFGFKEGIRQSIAQNELLAFYQEAVLINPAEAFSWLMDFDSPWSSEAGLTFLCREAAQQFGPESLQFRACINLYRIRLMRRMSDRYLSLNTKISDIRDRFHQLNLLLQQK